MKQYIAPQIKVVRMNPQGSVLVGSWNTSDKLGVNPDTFFGDQGAFE